MEKSIYKIKPGLYALNIYKKRLEQNGIFSDDLIKAEHLDTVEFNHSYYQGLLLEIGNLKALTTYVPQQDKNKLFLNKTLGSIAKIDKILDFSYPEIISRARTIDVIWFNDRGLLSSVFEVEHSTDIQNSLLKYNDLQDYHAEFYIVSAAERKREFDAKILYSAFSTIKSRVKFIDYKFVSDLHTKMFELSTVGTL